MKQEASLKAHLSSPKIGILLVNLGTPDQPTSSAVKKYLRQFLSDPRVVEIPKFVWWFILNGIILPIRSSASAKKYQSIWTSQGSPLLVYSQQQAAMLAKQYEADSAVVVDLAMRYGNPSIESVLDRFQAQDVDRLLVLPLYPQYSATTSASSFDEIFRCLMTWRNQPALRIVKHYHDHPAYIASLASKITAYWQEHGRPNFATGDKLVMSFHGLPRRTLDLGDPYHCECYKTGRLLREALGLSEQDVVVTFQSRFGRAEWLKPYTSSVLEAFGKSKMKRLDIVCPGFPADCLETLEEIAMEGREIFTHAGGGEYHAIPCLNEFEGWGAALAQIARENCQGWQFGAISQAEFAERQDRVNKAIASKGV